MAASRTSWLQADKAADSILFFVVVVVVVLLLFSSAPSKLPELTQLLMGEKDDGAAATAAAVAVRWRQDGYELPLPLPLPLCSLLRAAATPAVVAAPVMGSGGVAHLLLDVDDVVVVAV